MLKSLFLFVCLSTCQFDRCESEPLFLTPLIERGEIEAAQRRAEVKPFLPHVRSFSGYLTVDKKHNSNIFFWFFPKSSNGTNAPLILWLQGGPGTSSMFGLFCEHGPYVFEKGKLRRRSLSWTKFYNLLYVDAPVRTGFSFTNSSEGCSTTCAEGSDHLFQVLRQFFLLFPEMRKNKLILSGESYAGKYLSSLAYTIFTRNSTKPEINLWKIFLTSAFISMEDMVPHYSSNLRAHGLLDGYGENIIRRREELVLSHIRAKEYTRARDILLDMLFGFKNISLFRQLTGRSNTYSLVKENPYSCDPRYFVEFLNKKKTKVALHAEDIQFTLSNKNITMKQKDLLKSVKSEFGIVLESYKTLACYGQFDLATSYHSHTKVIESTDWSGNWDYMRAPHRPFRRKQILCGYYKVAKKYTGVMIRNSGHFIGEDQPRCLLELLQTFVNGGFDV